MENDNLLMKIAGKLGYQMIGTTLQSMGNNWSTDKSLFSCLTLGVGPINITIGKGYDLIRWNNNVFNILMNTYGLTVLASGGKVSFDLENLSFKYTGGYIDKLFPPNKSSSGFSPHMLSGNSGFNTVAKHETHHLWHSRALNDMYLFNYGLQGLNALLMKGDFIKKGNYYEDFVYHYPWW